MKYYYIPHFILLLTLLVCGCQSAPENKNSAETVKPQILKIADVVKAFQAEKLPLGQIEFFNAKSDPQQLLGKPGQYTEKAVWQTTEKIIHSVEAFAAETDVQSRKAAIEAAAAKPGASPLPQILAHKNILLVLHREMLPETVARFEKALKDL